MRASYCNVVYFFFIFALQKHLTTLQKILNG